MINFTWKDMNFLPQQLYVSLFVMLIIAIASIVVGCKVKKVDPKGKTPTWMIPWIMLVDILNNFTKENIGKRWKAYSPYFITLCMYLFVANTISIFGLPNPTSSLVINAALATISFLIIQISGIISQGILGYLKGFVDPIPVMLPINIISEISLPVALALRLMGNIMSGGVLSTLIIGLGGWFVVPVLPIYNAIFDLFSGTIQVVVFLLLTIIFASMKIKDEEKIYDSHGNLLETKNA